MSENSKPKFSDKAAERGEPSYIWRAGQERRLGMIRDWAGDRTRGVVLENGCGVGEYLARLGEDAQLAVGIDVEFLRLLDAKQKNKHLVCAAGEHLPFKPGLFDLVLSNEVIEHVQDDRQALTESVRVMRSGGRLALFCPNRGYPFETHGIYVRGEYRFGNKFFVNYLPRFWRDKLAPHVRVYTRRNLRELFLDLPVKIIRRTTIFGAYDNLIQKWPAMGKVIRGVLQYLERTPLRVLGLSHFMVIEKKTAHLV
jgi:SAM-dependent methyltransferase